MRTFLALSSQKGIRATGSSDQKSVMPLLARFRHWQEAFPGVDFSASGLQAVALVFKRSTQKMDISYLVNAPLLECLELEFVSIFDLKISAKIDGQRHDKPFQFTLVATNRPSERWHRWTLAPWQTLEEDFEPQQYKPSLGDRSLLHQTLLKDTGATCLQTYCNAAHMRAVNARRSRQAWATRSCDHRVFETKRVCVRCTDIIVDERLNLWMNI